MNNKRTIHAVVKYFYPVAAGIETNMLETYSVLAEKGWNVVIHTSKDTLTEQNVFSENETYRRLHIRRYQWGLLGFYPSIPYTSVDVVSLHNFNIVPHICIMLECLLRRLLHKKTPKLILVPHGGFTPDWEIFPLAVHTIKRLYHRTLGALLVNSSVQAVRAVSEWEKKEMMAYGIDGKLISVIPNGIEKEGLKLDSKKVSKQIHRFVRSVGSYIIQIGRIYNIKNYETTLLALSTLPNTLHYVIAGPVGDTKYLNKLKILIKKHNLTDRVHFVGVVRGYDKYFLIRSSEMMVHMARWESFCNVVHEGMSQGKVVIVADNTALRYLVEDGVNGFKIATNDSSALAKKIAYVLKNRKKILPIEKANFEKTKDQSWTNVVINIDIWLKKIINI